MLNTKEEYREGEPLTAPAGQHGRPIDLDALKELANRVSDVVTDVRERVLRPNEAKQPPMFNATALAKLCRKSNTTMMRLLDKAVELGLSDGTDPDNGGGKNKRRFTLEETMAWIRSQGPYFKRKPGQKACTIAVGNFKGGVGKTIAATSLAQALSLMGYKVLCVDLDPQASMTSLFDYDRFGVEDSQTILPLTLPADHEDAKRDLIGAIGETYWTGIDLVPASTSLFSGEFYLPLRQMSAPVKEPEFRFMEVLDRALDVEIRHEYDYIVIDTPPAISYVTLNAYWAADGILMPVPAEGLDLVSSSHFWTMFTTLSTSAQKTATREKIYSWIAIVPSKVDHTRGFTKHNLKIMQAAYEQYMLANVEIPTSSAVSVAGSSQMTVYDMEKYVGSNKTYERARTAFDRLAEEVDYLTRTRLWGQSPSDIERDLDGGSKQKGQ